MLGIGCTMEIYINKCIPSCRFRYSTDQSRAQCLAMDDNTDDLQNKVLSVQFFSCSSETQEKINHDKLIKRKMYAYTCVHIVGMWTDHDHRLPCTKCIGNSDRSTSPLEPEIRRTLAKRKLETIFLHGLSVVPSKI